MVILKSKKHVFWEALFITVVIFVGGLLLGVFLEAMRLNDINDFYAQSEISLLDIFAFNDLLSLGKVDCATLKQENINFANRIYEEARLLAKYEEVEKLGDSFNAAHKRYDLMRTLLWINVLEGNEVCEPDLESVVYLYELETEDLAQKGTQRVWSKVLLEVKEKKGDSIILIPIAVDTDVSSLNSLLNSYNISKYPVIIIGDEIINELKTSGELLELLN